MSRSTLILRLAAVFLLVSLFLPAQSMAATLMTPNLRSQCEIQHDNFALVLKNNFDMSIYVSVVYYNSKLKKWFSEGWLEVEPRGTETWELKNACPTSIGLYAEGDDNRYHWSGEDKNWASYVDDGNRFIFIEGVTLPPDATIKEVLFCHEPTLHEQAQNLTFSFN